MRAHAIPALALLALIALLTGCATMNQDDCLSADWYALGLEAGSEGESRDRLDRQRDACQKHGIAIDRAAWLEGYEYGLEDFCTPENGYQQGKTGRSYNNVCPSHLEGGFLLGYQQGKTLYDAEQQVAQVDHAMQQRANQINDAEYRIYRYQEVLANRNSSDGERQQALANIRYLQREIYNLRRELRELDYHRDTAVRQLMQIQAQGVQGW